MAHQLDQQVLVGMMGWMKNCKMFYMLYCVWPRFDNELKSGSCYDWPYSVTRSGASLLSILTIRSSASLLTSSGILFTYGLLFTSGLLFFSHYAIIYVYIYICVRNASSGLPRFAAAFKMAARAISNATLPQILESKRGPPF